MRRLLPFLVLALVSGCADPLTQVIVVLDTDLPLAAPNPAVAVEPGQLRELSITLLGPCQEDGTRCPAVFEDAAQQFNVPGAADFPASVGLVLEPDQPLGPYRLQVTAGLGPETGGTQQTVEAVFVFVENETRALPVYLVQACEGVSCGAGESCSNVGTCAPERRNALPPWTEDLGSYSLENVGE